MDKLPRLHNKNKGLSISRRRLLQAAATIPLVYLGVKATKVLEAASEPKITLTPEYERNLSEVMLSIPRGFAHNQDMINVYRNLLKTFPTYSKAIFFFDDIGLNDDIIVLQNLIKETGFEDRYKLVNLPANIQSEKGDLSTWAQDHSESINSGEALLVPAEEFAFDNEDIKTRNALKKSEKKIIDTPFYFEGGNMTIAKKPNGRTGVFLGYDTIIDTARLLFDMDCEQIISEDCPDITEDMIKQVEPSIKKTLKTFFGEDYDIEIMGDKKQAEKIFHIDQAMTFVSDRDVLVTTISAKEAKESIIATVELMQNEQKANGKPTNEEIKKYKDETLLEVFNILNQQASNIKHFKSLGYNIIECGHDLQDVLDGELTLNSIVYTDKSDGKKHLIFPIFPGEYTDVSTDDVHGQKYFLRGKADLMYSACKSLKIVPHPVPDEFFFKLDGSVHCITNVLAGLDKQDEVAKKVT